MNNFIIKGCGKMPDIIATLQTLRAIFGKGATLSDVATVARYTRLLQAERKQIKKGW